MLKYLVLSHYKKVYLQLKMLLVRQFHQAYLYLTFLHIQKNVKIYASAKIKQHASKESYQNILTFFLNVSYHTYHIKHTYIYRSLFNRHLKML